MKSYNYHLAGTKIADLAIWHSGRLSADARHHGGLRAVRNLPRMRLVNATALAIKLGMI